MKKYYLNLFVVVTLISCSSLKSQQKKEDEKLFTKGIAVFDIVEEGSFDYELARLDTTSLEGKIKFKVLYDTREDILDTALEYFEEIIKKHPKSNLYHKSLYNSAKISSLLDYENDEIKYLEMILKSKANDRENSGRNGIMSNPYANFKNEASNRLTGIYIQKKDFETALKYKKINENYPLQHFCGNAYAEDEIHNAQLYGEIYKGLGDTKKAISYLLPHMFNNGLASNSNIIDFTVKLLKTEYTKERLIDELNNSIKHYYSRIEKRNDEEWTNYYIRFFNFEIEVPSWEISYETDKKKIQSLFKKVILNSEFYKKLNE
ncbi:hypothetical protein [uncultured Tenacibaculum sp.]|uniref:tetratricopeptide repeat protein n=1 Tax=uncultured Tenacibaculum sp. TaxID=174713 RepID=UPI002617FC35|nr:hypothetical protein [uncultured Tenacibaculum sp.]